MDVTHIHPSTRAYEAHMDNFTLVLYEVAIVVSQRRWQFCYWNNDDCLLICESMEVIHALVLFRFIEILHSISVLIRF